MLGAWILSCLIVLVYLNVRGRREDSRIMYELKKEQAQMSAEKYVDRMWAKREYKMDNTDQEALNRAYGFKRKVVTK